MRSGWLSILLGWICLTAAGCPSRTLLDAPSQAILRHQLQDRVLFLKYSNFYGPFFAYPDRLYLCERAFDERVLLQNPAGEPIQPVQPIGVLPMGTRVRIRQIEFPTPEAIAARKLRSPLYFTWVLVERVDPPANSDPRPLVLVLTQEFRTPTQFRQALQAVLVDEDPSKDFAGRSPQELFAIDHKTLVKGMHPDALLRSRGQPERILRWRQAGVPMERWDYGPRRTVTLSGDRVVGWQGFGPLRPPTDDLRGDLVPQRRRR